MSTMVQRITSALLAEMLCGPALASTEDYVADAVLVQAGKVTRHTARGEVPHDAREAKRLEDEACLAGMRDPS